MDDTLEPGRRKDGKPYKSNNTRPDGSYAVGDRRTPEHTRFASGDGRKRGRRPKGQKNFDTDWEEELTKSVVIVENGKRKRTTAHRAQVKRTMERGGKGDHRAQQTIYQRADRLRERTETRSSLSDPELIRAWLVHQQMGEFGGIVGDDANQDFVEGPGRPDLEDGHG